MIQYWLRPTSDWNAAAAGRDGSGRALRYRPVRSGAGPSPASLSCCRSYAIVVKPTDPDSMSVAIGAKVAFRPHRAAAYQILTSIPSIGPATEPTYQEAKMHIPFSLTLKPYRHPTSTHFSRHETRSVDSPFVSIPHMTYTIQGINDIESTPMEG